MTRNSADAKNDKWTKVLAKAQRYSKYRVPKVEVPFTPATLHDFAAQVQTLRFTILCNVETKGADPEAELYFVGALDMLSCATHQLQLAAIKQAQTLTR